MTSTLSPPTQAEFFEDHFPCCRRRRGSHRRHRQFTDGQIGSAGPFPATRSTPSRVDVQPS